MVLHTQAHPPCSPKPHAAPFHCTFSRRGPVPPLPFAEAQVKRQGRSGPRRFALRPTRGPRLRRCLLRLQLLRLACVRLCTHTTRPM